MGLYIFCYSQERPDGPIHQWLKRIEQEDQESSLSSTKNTGCIVKARRLHTCHSIGPEHGSLPHWTRCRFTLVMCIGVSMGWVWNAMSANGLKQLPRHFPRANVWIDARTGICPNLCWWPIGDYQSLTPRPTKEGRKKFLNRNKKQAWKSMLQKYSLWRKKWNTLAIQSPEKSSCCSQRRWKHHQKSHHLKWRINWGCLWEWWTTTVICWSDVQRHGYH